MFRSDASRRQAETIARRRSASDLFFMMVGLLKNAVSTDRKRPEMKTNCSKCVDIRLFKHVVAITA
jgi:hypothetical protein